MKKTLKPANNNLKVRDPALGDYLPVDGRPVELNTYWRRRLKDESVVEVDSTKKKSAKSTSNEDK